MVSRWGQRQQPQHGACAPAQPPPPRPGGNALLSRHLGNGSCQATAKGARTQLRSLPSSPTHGRPHQAGQRTRSLRCLSGQVSRPARRCGRGRCHLGPFPDWRWPPALARCLGSPHPRVPLPPPPLSFPFLCLSVSLSFHLSWFLGLSVFLSESPSPLSPSIFVQSRPHRLLLPTPPPLPPPLGGPLPHPRSTFQPPPPPRRPSPEPAAAVVGSRDAAGRLELKSKVGSRRGLERAPPNNSGMWAGPAPRGWGKEVARPQTETAGDGWLHLPCAQPTPPTLPTGLAENQPNPGRPRRAPYCHQTQTNPPLSPTRALHPLCSPRERLISPAAQGPPYTTPPTVPNPPQPTLLGTTTSVNCVTLRTRCHPGPRPI